MNQFEFESLGNCVHIQTSRRYEAIVFPPCEIKFQSMKVLNLCLSERPSPERDPSATRTPICDSYIEVYPFRLSLSLKSGFEDCVQIPSLPLVFKGGASV